MALSPGSRIGSYEVTDHIGAGGMGEVFRAVDTALHRTVAIKVLPSSLAQDAERLARFEREAHTLASLNHPNIAQVYGFEKGADPALVMEYVDGPTLAERIAAGPLPLDEAIAIALQIAEALEAAHDLGIVHRDLKPANIKVRPDGAVKVLDFGLAKTVVRDQASGSMANSPTITTPAMTQAGVVLGTAAYMSPEQAKGKPVDRRTDIWAFGCVLFEMLTGTRAFAGDDVSDVLVAIIRDEPEWSRLPANAPSRLRSMLAECLRKDIKKRMPHIGVARITLSEPASAELVAPVAARTRRRTIDALVWALGGAAIAAAATLLLIGRQAPADLSRGPIRFEITPPEGGFFMGSGGVPRFSVSPDGRNVVFQATAAGYTPQLWLRSLDRLQSRPLLSASSASQVANDLSMQQPFWSPDSQQIAFFDENERKLKVTDVRGGGVQSLADVPGNQLGGSWNAKGEIIFSSLSTGGIRRLQPGGGQPDQVTKVDSSVAEIGHLWPEFLPDGEHFVYLVTGGPNPGLYVASLGGGVPKRILESTFMARAALPNRLLYMRGDNLMSQQFDMSRLELVGEPVVVADSVMRTTAGRVAVSVSRVGDLVYASGDNATDVAEAVWMSRAGSPDEAVQPIPTGGASIRLSSDGGTVAYSRANGSANELWIYDTDRRIATRLSSSNEAVNDAGAAFSPDGSQLFYRRESGPGDVAILRQAVSGVTPPTTVLKSDQSEFALPLDVSARGELLYATTRNGVRGLWTVPISGGTPAQYLAGTGSRIGNAALSPAGGLVAYVAGSSVSGQVFLQSFPDPAKGRWTVSGVGGAYPRWRRDGRELYFVDRDRWLNAVPVATEGQVKVGVATRLFQLPLYSQVQFTPYDVGPDGQRFLVIRRRTATRPAVLTVVVNPAR